MRNSGLLGVFVRKKPHYLLLILNIYLNMDSIVTLTQYILIFLTIIDSELSNNLNLEIE